MELTDAYAECERITWTQARNFAYGIRLLPPAKRRGLAVIYAFARRIDDIGDGTLPPEQKIADLEAARRSVLDLSPDGTDPVLLALADVARNFPVPMAAFGELIDGCVADVKGTSYQTFEDLLWYCRCVAGSVGRLSLGIFGIPETPKTPKTSRTPKTPKTPRAPGTRGDAGHASELADSLGVALQLTNILRDIREDNQNGRVYLPAEDLAKFDLDDLAFLGGPAPADPRAMAAPDPPQFIKLMEFQIERARDWYAAGLPLLAILDRRSAACTGAMAGIYRGLLDRIAADPAAVLRGRMSLSGTQKAVVAARALAGRIR